MGPATRSSTVGPPPLRRGRRWGLAVALVACLVAVSAGAGSTPGASAGERMFLEEECPPMTDSIVRLYIALFNRWPDRTEHSEWARLYSRGTVDLPYIAQELIESEEFNIRHGQPDDERFVEIVYRNVLRRDPPPAERDYWLVVLGRGHPRGTMLLAYTEAEEYTRRTNTSPPLAGYLRWYPRGTHWYCGIGSQANVRIEPLTNLVAYADYMFHNGGETTSRISINTVLDSSPHVTMTEGSIPPGFTSYTWGGAFEGDGDYGDSLNVIASEDTAWIAVFYPRWIGSQRLGWQIDK